LNTDHLYKEEKYLFKEKKNSTNPQLRRYLLWEFPGPQAPAQAGSAFSFRADPGHVPVIYGCLWPSPQGKTHEHRITGPFYSWLSWAQRSKAIPPSHVAQGCSMLFACPLLPLKWNFHRCGLPFSRLAAQSVCTAAAQGWTAGQGDEASWFGHPLGVAQRWFSSKTGEGGLHLELTLQAPSPHRSVGLHRCQGG
jgi:hypothetical protein